ncbi:MAG: hypothetical protein EXR73_14450 [Myxococcales bacterium]|nr:hypothetical protein [Myxococcales bacterium]
MTTPATRQFLLALAALTCALALPRPAHAEAPRFVHVPPAEAAPGQAVAIEALIERAWTGTLELRFRQMGAVEWQHDPFGRIGEGDFYLATIPAVVVAAPGFEYYVASTVADDVAVVPASRWHFATPDNPHRVQVHESRAAIMRRRELERVGNRRARARVAAEWIDFGAQRFGDLTLADRYYRVDADFTYRVLRFPLYSLRFGYTRLRGDTPAFVGGVPGPADDTTRCGGEDDQPDCNDVLPAGFDGGWFETRFRVTSLIDLDLRGIAAATATTIHPGFRVEARIGPESGSHVAFGTEGIADTGSSWYMRLAWDTVPRLPMAATIEITDLPSENRKSGVRLVYDIGYQLSDGLRLGLRAGYQARESLVGGVSAGLGAQVEF